jgi:hypothetical protein
MKELFQTFDGKVFDKRSDAENHEDEVLTAALRYSGVAPFLETLNDDDFDEWYSTDRRIGTNIIERLLTWCRENNKRLTVVDN